MGCHLFRANAYFTEPNFIKYKNLESTEKSSPFFLIQFAFCQRMEFIIRTTDGRPKRKKKSAIKKTGPDKEGMMDEEIEPSEGGLENKEEEGNYSVPPQGFYHK
eukprot:TRINITY_DN2467_c0_g1_i1.p2 TRINITY_DN2467_c0_g1~~TRINITY_DN2467_c0_g1_i1.p2  ORF type:complete len:104 (+),score=19.71 TRINITY_DN2467_c0_g1_i1:72-383(+)